MTWRGEENSAVGVVLDRGLVLFGFGGGLALLQLGHRLLQHFGMRDQIVVHDLLDRAALGGRECSCARRPAAAPSAAMASNGGAGKAQRRRRKVMAVIPCRSLSVGWRVLGDLTLDDVVGLHPGGRADRQTGLGARGELARGLDVAAREGGLRGGEIGLREVALAAVGHGELRVGVRPLPARVRARRAAARSPRRRPWRCSVAISACASMIWISARLWRERDGAAQRRDRLGGAAAFEQRLALELVEIGIVRLRLDQARRSARWRLRRSAWR